ncbi:MAG: LapA family protein [Colwellia sp.]|nr:LapA family protein [Colwellia sp.]
MQIYFTLFFVFILLSIAFVFGSQNEQIVSLNYLIARVELSVAAAVSLFTAIGFVLGVLVTLLWRLIRKSKKALAKKRSSEV